MPFPTGTSLLLGAAVVATLAAAAPAAPKSASPTPAPLPPGVTAIDLPGAPPDGLWLDYLAVDRARRRVWVPAGATGNTVVIDADTKAIHSVGDFPTAEVERNGKKRTIGPSSATIGNGVVYVGNRGDSSVCAIDAATLARRGCVTLPSMPDGVVYVARTKEVWVTAPRDRSILVLDVSDPVVPRMTIAFKLEGDPEGYAVDDEHGLFYTNLEDRDRTLRIDAATRRVTADWSSACGPEGPRGLALADDGRYVLVACTDHIETLDTRADGKIISKLIVGDGLDNLDFLPAKKRVYAAAGGAATLTTATVDGKGRLERVATAPTVPGARNAVATEDGTAFVASGARGQVLIVPPPK